MNVEYAVMEKSRIIPPGTQRVFIGIPVDRRSQKHITGLLKPVINSRLDAAWVPESNRHLTLAFLGDRPIFVIEDLLRVFDETYQQQACFQFSLRKLTRFPDVTGRIIALTGESTGPLENLFQITRKLLRIKGLEFDRKPFRPHVTLGRIRRAKHVKMSVDQHVNINLDVTKISLYQSTLTETGSVYTSLKETQLHRSSYP